MTPEGAAAGGQPADRWPASLILGLVVTLAAGVIIRAFLLPTGGLRGDLDQFVLWVHGIAVGGLPNAYDQNLSFPPVMAYVWGLLAAVQPAFQTVTDASDPAIRALMKTPASVADIGLALLVASALRDRPRWAVVAAAAIALHPAVFDISAWWGQYESLYMVSALAAVICAVRGRNGLAAALLAVALMTKPQVLPFLVPFAAWFWATGGWRGLARTALIGAAVIVVLWLPFIQAGGPANYLKNLGEYQGEIFNILSLRAWNLWWLVQSLFAGGGFVADDVAFLGPLTLRHVGYVLTGLLEVLVALSVLRDPRPRTLHPGPGRLDAGRVLLPHEHARALCLRGARLPDAAHPRDPGALARHRVRRRLHAEPPGRGAADTGDRRARAGRRLDGDRWLDRDARDRHLDAHLAGARRASPGRGLRVRAVSAALRAMRLRPAASGAHASALA